MPLMSPRDSEKRSRWKAQEEGGLEMKGNSSRPGCWVYIHSIAHRACYCSDIDDRSDVQAATTLSSIAFLRDKVSVNRQVAGMHIAV